MMEYQDTIEIYDPVEGSWQTHHSLMLTGRGTQTQQGDSLFRSIQNATTHDYPDRLRAAIT
jgi:hypothetical protein